MPSEFDDLLAVVHEQDVRLRDDFDPVVAHFQLTQQVVDETAEITAHHAERFTKATTPAGQEIAVHATNSGIIGSLLRGVLGIAKAHTGCQIDGCRTCEQIKITLPVAAGFAAWQAQQSAN